MLAHRTKLIAASGTAKARAAVKAAGIDGHALIDLTAGEIWSDLAPTIREGALDAVRSGLNRYTDTIGSLDLRAELACRVSRDTGQVYSSDEIAVTNGAKQALFNVAMVLLNPGDEVIIPSPYWSTFPAQALLAGATPVHVDTKRAGFVARARDIEAAVTGATRAIVVNTPNNPTGAVYGAATLSEIADLARRRDLWIIFDECYGTFAHKRHRHHQIVTLAPDVRSRTVIVNAFSKSLALTGWRIGYLAAPKEVVAAVAALQSHTTSNPNVVAQQAVLHHLIHGDGSFEAQLQARLSATRDIGLEELSRLTRIKPPRADGGFYFYLDLAPLFEKADGPRTTQAVRGAVDALLARAGVAAVAGHVFGDPAGLRLSYGVDAHLVRQGCARLVREIERFDETSICEPTNS